MNYPSVFVFIRPSQCFLAVAVAARWRRGGRGGRACAAAMVRKTKSELGFGNGGITTTSSGIGICRSDGNGDDDPGMVASPSPPPSSVVRGPGHCRGRVSGTTHSAPFSHQTDFLRLRQAESHTPTITTKLRLPPTTGEMRQTKFLRLRRAAMRTHAIGDGASGGTWQTAIPPSTSTVELYSPAASRG